MIARFDAALGQETATAWLARLVSGAALFWGSGLAAYAWRHGVAQAQATFLALPTPVQVGLLVAVPLVLAGSDQVARRFQLTLLRWLEGYWPERLPLAWLRRRLLARRRADYRRLEAEWQRLQAAFEAGRLRPEGRERLGRVEVALHRYPDAPDDMLPTMLGTRLRAAETRPLHRYGLDGVVCWPALWLLLPEPARREVSAARAELNAAVRFTFWGALTALWAIWAWWAAPLAGLLAWLGYRAALEAADGYATLVEATFAVHRFALYDALGLPRPSGPEEERRAGEALTRWLWTGEAPNVPERRS